MENLPWVLAAITLPIPIFHFWLHALLPWWRKNPLLFYVFCGTLWVAAFALFKAIAPISSDLFTPTEITTNIGQFLVILGFLMVLWSIYSLTPKRFFLWAVFRPESVIQKRIKKGAFRFIPHPAYNGYLIASLGAVLISGALYTIIVFVTLLIITPIMIWLEENELTKRLSE